MVTIVDYGMGNVASVQKALKFLNVESEITNDALKIKESSAIILPGVGSFQQGMYNLRESNLIDLLTKEVVENKKKFLGICLGMQLIATRGKEPEPVNGLGWVQGEVVKIEADGRRIPHLGWNEITVKNDQYFEDVSDPNFYFIHSYQFKVNNPDQVSSVVNYNGDIVASITSENIFATQFHPEKSQKSGLAVLMSFLNA